MNKDNEQALAEAMRLQQRAAELGFDWPDIAGVWDKLAEELDELRDARDVDSIQHELGDIFFALVNLSRFLDCDPDLALALANERFRNRFAYVERHMQTHEGALALEQMERWWQEAKRLERQKMKGPLASRGNSA